MKRKKSGGRGIRTSTRESAEEKPGQVVSMVPELVEREYARLRTAADRSGRRDLHDMVEAVDLHRQLAQVDFDAMLSVLAQSDDPEAAEAIAGLCCARALVASRSGKLEAAFREWDAVIAEH